MYGIISLIEKHTTMKGRITAICVIYLIIDVMTIYVFLCNFLTFLEEKENSVADLGKELGRL